jgi:hypothetical protein
LSARCPASNCCPKLAWDARWRARCHGMPTHKDYPWERDKRAAKNRSHASSVSGPPTTREEPVWSAAAAKKLGLPATVPAKTHRPRRSWRLRRYHRRSFLGLRQAARARATAGVCLLLTAAALAQHLDTHGRVGIGAPHSTLPGAYVAVQGPWHYRWVRVINPPPGTPAYVRQRYRTIRYVAQTPAP